MDFTNCSVSEIGFPLSSTELQSSTEWFAQADTDSAVYYDTAVVRGIPCDYWVIEDVSRNAVEEYYFAQTSSWNLQGVEGTVPVR